MFNPRVMMIGSGYEGCNYPRIYLPATFNGFWTDKPSMLDNQFNLEDIKNQLDEADVIVFHRAEEQTYHDLAKFLKDKGKKIVVDNDDTFKVEAEHPLMNFNANGSVVKDIKRREDNMNSFMEMCDLVTCSTETLKKEYSQFNKNVVVLPNYVDPDDWSEPLRNEGDKVRIGIVGSTALEYDYLHVKDLIKKLSEREDIELVLIGLGDKKHQVLNPEVTKKFKEEYKFWNEIKAEQFPWCRRADYNRVLNEARLDIMLIPRRENYFNTCKSNIKFLEASMCEVPVIAQSFNNAPYEEITEDMGVLIRDNYKWEQEINRLVNDKELRRSMGKKAREYVIKNYNIADHYEEWNTAYSNLYETN